MHARVDGSTPAATASLARRTLLMSSCVVVSATAWIHSIEASSSTSAVEVAVAVASASALNVSAHSWHAHARRVAGVPRRRNGKGGERQESALGQNECEGAHRRRGRSVGRRGRRSLEQFEKEVGGRGGSIR
eukprot:372593-Pleurochrysis_carterae.AAC.5